MRSASSIACSLTLAVGCSLSADEVRLEDGSTITGSVLGLDAGTSLLIEADISAKPLSLRADQIRKVSFTHEENTEPGRDATLMLVNGDRIPCDVIGISDESLTIMTNAGGQLSIDRSIVSSVELGMQPRRVIYQGPSGLEDWKVEDGWQFEENAFVSEGDGSIARPFEGLPESFSLSFLLSWSQNPNFQVYFCSSHDEGGGGKHDRYYLQFNKAGFEIKRQSSGSSPYQSLGIIDRPPKSFGEPKAQIELRVDRDQRLIHFYIDGKLEGSYDDPLPKPPAGNSVVFHSNLKDGEGHHIQNIILKEWDSTGDRHRSEDRGEGDGDALIDYEGQRFSGKLLQTSEKDGGSVVLFQSPHFPKALEIPLDQVSTIFMARPSGTENRSELVLNLGGGGFLSATDCRFAEDKVKVEHPLLGSIEITRDSLLSMVKRAEDDSETPNEDEE